MKRLGIAILFLLFVNAALLPTRPAHAEGNCWNIYYCDNGHPCYPWVPAHGGPCRNWFSPEGFWVTWQGNGCKTEPVGAVGCFTFGVVVFDLGICQLISTWDFFGSGCCTTPCPPPYNNCQEF